MPGYINNTDNKRIIKLEEQLKLQIQINQKLLEVIKMIEPFYKERYANINELIELQKESVSSSSHLLKGIISNNEG